MDKETLKKKLHEQIDALDDEFALNMLHEAAVEYNKSGDIMDELTPEQLNRLEQSLEQAKKGNTVSNEEAQKKINEWLTK